MTTCGCSSGCGLVGSCFGCPKLIKGLTRPKFEWLLCFMFTLARQCWVHAASIPCVYIYIRRYLSICLYHTLANPVGGFF